MCSWTSLGWFDRKSKTQLKSVKLLCLCLKRSKSLNIWKPTGGQCFYYLFLFAGLLSRFWSWDRSRKDYLPFGDKAQLNIYKSAFRYCSCVVDSFQAWDFLCPLLVQMLYTPWRDLWESNCIIFGICLRLGEAMGTKMCFSDRLLATKSLKIQIKCILC